MEPFCLVRWSKPAYPTTPIQRAPKVNMVARGIHRLISRLFSRNILRAKGLRRHLMSACEHSGACLCECGIYVLRSGMASEGRSPILLSTKLRIGLGTSQALVVVRLFSKMSIKWSQRLNVPSARRTTAVTADSPTHCLYMNRFDWNGIIFVWVQVQTDDIDNDRISPHERMQISDPAFPFWQAFLVPWSLQ